METAYLLNPLLDEVWSWTTFSVELAEYACTQSYFPNPFLDYKNSEDCATGSSDDDDYEYEEPDLSGGVKGVDYRIVYGRGDNIMDPKAEE